MKNTKEYNALQIYFHFIQVLKYYLSILDILYANANSCNECKKNYSDGYCLRTMAH